MAAGAPADALSPAVHAAKYPNGCVLTDDVIDYRLALLTKGECPPSGLKPHTDILKEFPYLGPPIKRRTRASDFHVNPYPAASK